MISFIKEIQKYFNQRKRKKKMDKIPLNVKALIRFLKEEKRFDLLKPYLSIISSEFHHYDDLWNENKKVIGDVFYCSSFYTDIRQKWDNKKYLLNSLFLYSFIETFIKLYVKKTHLSIDYKYNKDIIKEKNIRYMYICHGRKYSALSIFKECLNRNLPFDTQWNYQTLFEKKLYEKCEKHNLYIL